MQQFVFPSYQVGGHILEQSGGLIARFGRRALIVGGEKGMAAAMPALETALRDGGVTIAGRAWYGGECTYAHMDRLAALGRAAGADVVLGVGGGKALDTAKGCARKMNAPVITVPTIAATCAAVTKLSVVYDENSVFKECMLYDTPPAFALIDTALLARSPARYLLAGIGDALAKHVECSFTTRGRALPHACGMAVALSKAAYEPHFQYAKAALADMARFEATMAVEQAALANIVTTGMVSLMLEEVYNGGVAHALFYGLTTLPDFEKNCLHGHAVGYGVLVQLALDGQTAEYARLRALYGEIGMPKRLGELGYALTDEVLDAIVPLALTALRRDRVTPYEVSPERLREALLFVEA